jgi:hypothetical protein
VYTLEQFLGYYLTQTQAILDAAPLETDSAVIKALRDLFWHLRYRSLPVSPLPLTEAFGWKGYQIHEQQDLFEFYRVFSAKLEKDLGSVVIACTKGQYKTTNHDPEYGDSSRIEEFYGRSCADVPAWQ